MTSRLAPLFLLGVLTALPSRNARAEEESPYFFADDTLDMSERDRQPRTMRSGPRTYAKDEPESGAPEYRKERSPLEDLKYLAPGSYEAKIVGVLCNACTDAVLAELKRLPQIGKSSFDYEEGVLRFVVRQPKEKEDKKAPKGSAEAPTPGGFFFFGRRPDAPLRFSSFRRAVTRAGRRANLGVRFTVAEITRVR